VGIDPVALRGSPGHHAARHYTGGSSQSLISNSGDSEFYHQRQRKEAISAEIKACLDLYFGGHGEEEKQMLLAVSASSLP
jgi:hypothetical protein